MTKTDRIITNGLIMNTHTRYRAASNHDKNDRSGNLTLIKWPLTSQRADNTVSISVCLCVMLQHLCPFASYTSLFFFSTHYLQLISTHPIISPLYLPQCPLYANLNCKHLEVIRLVIKGKAHSITHKQTHSESGLPHSGDITPHCFMFVSCTCGLSVAEITGLFTQFTSELIYSTGDISIFYS